MAVEPAGAADAMQQSCVALPVAFRQGAVPSKTVGVTPPPSRLVPLTQIEVPPAVEPAVTSSPVNVIDSVAASN